MPRGLLLLALVTVALVVPIGPAGATIDGCQDVPPGLGARLMEVPTHLADDPRAQSRIIDEVQPGATIERRVRFTNGEPDRTLDLRIAPLPATVEDGAFLIDTDGADGELAGWVSLDEREVTLGPCELIDVRAVIEVPPDAEAGERYAAVTATHAPDAEGPGVHVASRIGVRIYLQVAGPEPATSDFEIDALIPGRSGAGDPTIDVVITNTGERAVDVAGELELTEGPGGVQAGPFSTGRTTTLAPGDEGTATVVLDADLPLGPWRAEVTMRSGELQRRAEAEITFPAEVGTSEAVDASPLQDRNVLIPLAGGLLLAALLLLLLYALRRRRDDEERDGDGPDGGDAGRRAAVGAGGAEAVSPDVRTPGSAYSR